MDSGIDIKKMFDDGAKAFDDLVFGAGDSDESGDEFPLQIPSGRTKEKEDSEDNKTFSMFNTKVEDKGKVISFDDVHFDMDLAEPPIYVQEKLRNELVEEVMKKSVIGPGFDKLESVPPYEISKKKMLQEKRKKRESNRGEDWFNMPAADITEEIKNDLKVLQMRSVLDRKTFYKKNSFKNPPKYFHVGRVIESPADFYNSRIPKKQRKQTMVDELLCNAEFQQYNKKRYMQITENQKKTSLKDLRRARKQKRKAERQKKKKQTIQIDV